MSSSSKRQTTMAKRAREQSLRERRERKQEKKQAAKLAKEAGSERPPDTADELTPGDEAGPPPA